MVNEKEKLQEIKAGRKPLTLERPGLMPATAKIIVAIKPKGEGEAVFLSQKHFFVDDKYAYFLKFGKGAVKTPISDSGRIRRVTDPQGNVWTIEGVRRKTNLFRFQK